MNDDMMAMAIRFLLDDPGDVKGWGDSLKLLITFLVVVIVGFGAIIWWLRR